jgi:hypothetical protein
MVPLPMVVRHERVQGMEQPALSKQDEAIETLLSDGAHEAPADIAADPSSATSDRSSAANVAVS